MRRAAIIVVALLIVGAAVLPLLIQGHITAPRTNSIYSSSINVTCASVWDAWTQGPEPATGVGTQTQVPTATAPYQRAQCDTDRRNKAIMASALFGAAFLVFVFGLVWGGSRRKPRDRPTHPPDQRLPGMAKAA
jgi:hypothetical protein